MHAKRGPQCKGCWIGPVTFDVNWRKHIEVMNFGRRVCLATSMDNSEGVIIFRPALRTCFVLSQAGAMSSNPLMNFTVNLACWRLPPFLSHLLRVCAHVHAHASLCYSRGRLLKTLYIIFLSLSGMYAEHNRNADPMR